MRELTNAEMLSLTGGKAEAWSPCDAVIAAGNMINDATTEEELEAWAKAFEELCGKQP